jgi:hypothetical protein
MTDLDRLEAIFDADAVATGIEMVSPVGGRPTNSGPGPC